MRTSVEAVWDPLTRDAEEPQKGFQDRGWIDGRFLGGGSAQIGEEHWAIDPPLGDKAVTEVGGECGLARSRHALQRDRPVRTFGGEQGFGQAQQVFPAY